MHNIVALWETWADDLKEWMIVLEDINHKPIGSIDLTKWYEFEKPFVISETNNLDRYYLYIPTLGLGLYFTYFKKLAKESC